MRALRRFLKRFFASTIRHRSDAGRDEEIEQHLALQTEDNLRAGMSPEEARRQAVLKFGPVTAIKEDWRNQRVLPLLEVLLHDFRRALRRLFKTPGFTITAMLTLALGIGVTTSIFTLVHAVLLESLPVSNPNQLYRIGEDPHCCVSIGFVQPGEWGLLSNALYDYLRDNTGGFEELAAFDAPGVLLGVRRTNSGSPAESYLGEFVSGNFFAMLGVNANPGRVVSKFDDKPNAPPVAVMSYRVWAQNYGLDPSVIGATFNINDKPFTVVGVTPPSFYGARLSSAPPDFYLPLAAEPLIKGESSILNKPDTHWLNVIGRVSPQTNIALIEAKMRVELRQWLESHRSEMSASERTELPRQTLNLGPGGAGITSMRQQYGDSLWNLLTISGFVMLIVCANVANLMLVRTMERRDQISLSVALGAPSSRIVRAALTESVVLSLAGGAAGLVIAFAGTRFILDFAFEAKSMVPISAAPSGMVLIFAFALALLSAVLFGTAPAWLSTRVSPIEALRGANRSTRASGARSRKTLVVLQAALSVALLSGAGLLLQTLRNFEDQDLGFQRDHRIIAGVDPLLGGYKPEQLNSLYKRIHDSLTAIPGVASVACALYTPQSGDDWEEGIYVQGKPAPGPNADNGAGWSRVSPGFFEASGIRILRGRPLGEQDTAHSRHVAVINESLAHKFFKDEDPIGKHFGKESMKYAGDYEIVGVAKDARFLNYNLDKPVAPFFLLPESQFTHYMEQGAASTELRSHYLHDIVMAVRPGANLPEILIRRALASVDSNLPLVRIESMDQQVARTFSQQRLVAYLASLFGILALVLASLGLYGVTSYNMGFQVKEIGVRMALGAGPRDVVALVLREGFVLIASGLLLGVPLAVILGRLLGNQVYGITPYDPAAISIAIAILAGCAFVATIIPAFRASSISPLRALRVD